MSRRLPVYVLLDCSESMIGPGIEGLQLAVDSMLRELRRNPQALETVWLSFITFHFKASRTPLTPLYDVMPPQLQIAPGTALGAALRLTAEALRTEVRMATPQQRGDWKPIVFIITDGQATDAGGAGSASFAGILNPKAAHIYAIGCGDDVDYHQLGLITPNVLKTAEATPEAFGRLFVWLSKSLEAASIGIAEKGGDGALTDALPEQVKKVSLEKEAQHDGKPRYVFVRLHCTHDARPYLMRYKSQATPRGSYTGVSAHPLPPEITAPDTRGNDFQLPPVDSNLLYGTAPCPYCAAASWFHCGTCHALNCMVLPAPKSTTCALCKTTARLGGGSFSVQQGAG